jgi:hypothetical protein
MKQASVQRNLYKQYMPRSEFGWISYARGQRFVLLNDAFTGHGINCISCCFLLPLKAVEVWEEFQWRMQSRIDCCDAGATHE